jgi:ADP-heptose:LPS heptosyltransferase/GT2 family glycosyltransferase
MVKYTVSIVCHNRRDLTEACLRSVLAHSKDAEIVVTDNNSTDGTAEYLKSLYGKIKIITKFSNTGFVEPHNRALVGALGKYFVVLNNDAEVCANWLDIMANEFCDPKVAIVGTKASCHTLDKGGTGFKGRTLDYIEGSCLMIPVAIARHHGLFDPAYKLIYFEDSDLSLRLREIGYKIVAVDIPIVHQKSSSTCNLVRKEGKVDLDGYYIRNQHIFRNRWKKYLERHSFAKKILVIRDHALGDVVLVTPVLDALKIKYPNSEIDFVTKNPEGLAGNVSARILSYGQVSRNDYDLVFDLNMAYERQPFKHIVQAYAEACGVEKELSYTGYRPYLFPTKDDEAWASATTDIDGAPSLAIHPGPTNWAGRNWPARKFAEVTQHFIGKGWRVFLIGTKRTDAVDHTHDLRGQTTYLQMASLLRNVNLFIGIDSSPMHAAVWADTAIAAVFGCIDPKLRLPPDAPPWFRGVTAEGVGCLGCHHFQSAPRMESGCLREKVYCMEKLTVDRFISEAEAAIREKELQ